MSKAIVWNNLVKENWSTALSSLNEYEQNIRATADSNGVLSTEAEEALAVVEEYEDIIWKNADPETRAKYSSEYQQINDLIAIAIERKQQLSEPAVMPVSTEGLDANLASGIGAPGYD